MVRPGRRAPSGAVSLLVAALVLAACGGGSDDAAAGSGALAGEAIRLEPLDSAQPDPFVDANLDMAEELGQAIAVELVDPPATDDEVATGLSGQVAQGTAEGLYGGTLDTAVCDAAQLVAFLTDPANGAQAGAWAEVQGITPAEIPSFVAGLTPVRLRLDTRVTNHGFDGSRATPFQSVLQAGTAVLVDDRGVPRAKCFCGNPLAEPEPIDAGAESSDALDLDTLAENPEDAWPELDPEQVATVEPGEPTDSFVLGDLQTGTRFERPKGTNGTDDTPQPADGTSTTPTTASADPSAGAEPGSGSGGGGGQCTEQRPDGAVIIYQCGAGDRGGGSSATVCENEYGPNGEVVSRRCYVP
jgi:hypothetical protein